MTSATSYGGHTQPMYFLASFVLACHRALEILILLILLQTSVSAQETDPGYTEPSITSEDREHWAFQRPVDSPIPPHSFTAWRRNEIDDFIAAALQKHNLKPQPAADPNTLLRRLSYDLIGLPPTISELETFSANPSEQAFAATIKRLLHSRQYGEHWAQHWLDLARFAETDGFEHDKVRKNAWRYRDWVIQALNKDLAYDEFIRRQIAGDELYPDDENIKRATGFCISGPDMPDINLQEERRHTLLNEITSTVGAVVLGLQIGCAQCHDHKYDAISQADFYRFRAAFEPAIQLTKNKSLSAVNEAYPFQKTSHVMLRGDFREPGLKVTPGVIRVAADAHYVFRPVRQAHTAGFRTALAEWLTSDTNPLTARVIVNRVWQHHFGDGLVTTPSDFGLMGADPSNYELLDWLAVWFMKHDWSLKNLHRLIVQSATYRQRSMLPIEASAPEQSAWQASLKLDADAALLSRYPRWRLQGEAIRDAILMASGQLNDKSDGPGVRPPLPTELVGTLLKNQWNVSPDIADHNCRSIYVFARRNLRYPIFEVFDRPASNTSCPERHVSTTAPQSLHLLNSRFTLSMAENMAKLVMGTHTDERKQIQTVFLRTLSRQPTAFEVAESERFLATQTKSADRNKAFTHLCLALFNSSEFIFVD